MRGKCGKGALDGVHPPVAFQIVDRIDGVSEGHPVQAARGFLLLKGGSPVAAAGSVGAEVGDDAKDPGGEFGFVAVTVKVLVSADKSFLDDVFGVVAAARHLVGEAKNEKAVPLEQKFERPVFAVPRLAYQDRVAFQF